MKKDGGMLRILGHHSHRHMQANVGHRQFVTVLSAQWIEKRSGFEQIALVVVAANRRVGRLLLGLDRTWKTCW